MPEHVLEVLARFARAVRESPSVDPRSGVSARFAIAAAETVAGAALRRAGLLAATAPRTAARGAVARVGDAVSVTSTLRGKVEFESGEEGREIEILAHLLRTATAETFRARLAGLDLSGFTALVEDGAAIETGELVSAAELLRQVGTRARPGEGPGPARPGRRAHPGGGGGCRRVRAGRAAPDPPARQGRHRLRAHRLRRPGLTVAGNRFRYGQWNGGPDPLAPPYDVREAVDAVGAEVLAGGSLREALRDLLRRGPQGRGGLDDLAARARRLRREALRRGDLDGAVTRAQALLDQALAAERDELRGRDDDAARFAESVLDNLPRSTARAVEELSGYQWASDDARRSYQQILDQLRDDVLGQRFAGLRDAVRASADPAAQQRLAEMMGDLNDLLARHGRAEDTTDAFAEFMRQTRRLLPGEAGERSTS